MDKVLYFKNDDQQKDYCAGKVYRNFLEYAFARTFSMLMMRRLKDSGSE